MLMLERSVRIREVMGSNPIRSTKSEKSEPFSRGRGVRIFHFPGRIESKQPKDGELLGLRAEYCRQIMCCTLLMQTFYPQMRFSPNPHKLCKKEPRMQQQRGYLAFFV